MSSNNNDLVCKIEYEDNYQGINILQVEGNSIPWSDKTCKKTFFYCYGLPINVLVLYCVNSVTKITRLGRVVIVTV